MANSWKFMLKKNQLTCFSFDMNFHKLLYKPFLFFYLYNYACKDTKQKSNERKNAVTIRLRLTTVTLAAGSDDSRWATVRGASCSSG